MRGNKELKLLFISMSPLSYNTSAMIRLHSYISGCAKKGNTCDVVSLSADKNSIMYDSDMQTSILKYVNRYVTFQSKLVYKAVSTKKQKQSNVFRMMKSVYAWFNVTDSQIMNVPNVLDLDLDFNAYDRIISVSDPISSHYIVSTLVKHNRIRDIGLKWIQCWGDPWSTDITRNDGIKKIIIKKKENELLSASKEVVYVSPLTLEEKKRQFPKLAYKMKCITQSMRNSANEAEIQNHHKYILGYFGNYSSLYRNIMPLYKCCKNNKYKAIIVGSSDIELKSNDNISIIKKVPLSEVDRYEGDTSIIVCICNTSGTQIPGKIYYEAGNKKPIIVIVDSPQKDSLKAHLESFHRYIICDNDELSICNAIEEARSSAGYYRSADLDQRFYDTYNADRLLSG